MQTYTEVTFDIRDQIKTKFIFNKGDNNSHFIKFKLLDGGRGKEDRLNLIGASAVLYVMGNSGVSYIDAEVAEPENGVVTVEIPGSVTAAVGDYTAQLRLTSSSDHHVLAAKKFDITVEDTIFDDGAIMATPEYSALVARTMAVDELRQHASVTDARLDELVANPATDNTELADIRVDVDGNTHLSAGTAVRAQVSEMRDKATSIENAVCDYNPINTAALMDHATVTQNDVTYTWLDGETCEIYGESASTGSMYVMNAEGMPKGVHPSDTIQINFYCDDNNVALNVRLRDENGDTLPDRDYYFKSNKTLVIDDETASIYVRLWVNGSSTVNTTATVKIMTMARSDEVSDTKTDSLIADNSFDVLSVLPKFTRSQSGIDFVWHDNHTCTVSGNLETSATAYNLYFNLDKLPLGVVPGQKLWLKFHAEYFRMSIAFAIGGELDLSTERWTYDDIEITVPTNATGMRIRFYIHQSLPEAETVTPTLLTAPTNYGIYQELINQTSAINSRYDALNNFGINKIPVAEWRRGVVSYITGNGLSSVVYRAYTVNIWMYDKDVTVYPAPGYAIMLMFYDENGNYVEGSHLGHFDANSNFVYGYVSRGVFVGKNTKFRITVRRTDDKTTDPACNLEQMSRAVSIADGYIPTLLHDGKSYHSNPRDYYALKCWMDAITEPIRMIGDGLPTSDNEFIESGKPAGSYMIGTNYCAAFNRDADIFYNSNLASWRSMLQNPVSKLFTEQWTWNRENPNLTSYYGAVCSSFVSFLLCQDIFYKADEYYATADSGNDETWATSNSVNPEWLENDLFIWKNPKNISEIEIGDIYVKDGHVAIISDAGCDENGLYVVLFEQQQPYTRATKYNNESFFVRLNSEHGNVGRFKNNHRIRDPKEIDTEYCVTCFPDKGDKSTYLVSENIKLYVPKDTVVSIDVLVDGASSWQTFTPTQSRAVAGGYEYTLPNLGVGTHKISPDGGQTWATVCVVDTGTVTVDVDGNFVCEGISGDCTPLYTTVMYVTAVVIDPTAPISYEYSVNVNGVVKKAIPYYGTKALVDGESGAVEVPEYVLQRPNGWYVRMQYKTPFGQVHCDSNIIPYQSGNEEA